MTAPSEVQNTGLDKRPEGTNNITAVTREERWVAGLDLDLQQGGSELYTDKTGSTYHCVVSFVMPGNLSNIASK